MSPRQKRKRPDAGALTDEIMQRLLKARGICAIAGAVPGCEDEMPDVALPDALWAARELLEETEALVWKLAARAGVAHA